MSREIPAIAFVGRKNSGKTTLLEKLIAELVGRGVKVGTVKHHSHLGFEFDHEGKDSYRHREAGSSFAVVASPDQIGSVRSLDRELELEEILATMTGVDIVLCEGYRTSHLPTVELFRSGNQRDLERKLGGEGNEVIGVVTDIPRIEQAAKEQGLPVFSFVDISRLASFVVSRVLL